MSDKVFSVLIVKTSSLGDIVQSFPLLHALKSRFSSLNIDWVVEKDGAGLIQEHPLIDNSLVIDTKKWKKKTFTKEVCKEVCSFFRKLRKKNYDLVIDLQGNCKSALFTFLSRSQVKLGFAMPNVKEWPNILATNIRFSVDLDKNIRGQYLELIEKYFSQNFAKFLDSHLEMSLDSSVSEEVEELFHPFTELNSKVAVVFPFSKKRSKELSMEQLGAFLQKVHEKLRMTFLISWISEEQKVEAIKLKDYLPSSSIRLFPKIFSVSNLTQIIDRADLIIGMDSFPLHLCGYYTCTPSFSFFGPSSSHCFKPLGEHTAYQHPCRRGHLLSKTCPCINTCRAGEFFEKIDINNAVDELITSNED